MRRYMKQIIRNYTGFSAIKYALNDVENHEFDELAKRIRQYKDRREKEYSKYKDDLETLKSEEIFAAIFYNVPEEKNEFDKWCSLCKTLYVNSVGQNALFDINIVNPKTGINGLMHYLDNRERFSPELAHYIENKILDDLNYDILVSRDNAISYIEKIADKFDKKKLILASIKNHNTKLIAELAERGVIGEDDIYSLISILDLKDAQETLEILPIMLRNSIVNSKELDTNIMLEHLVKKRDWYKNQSVLKCINLIVSHASFFALVNKTECKFSDQFVLNIEKYSKDEGVRKIWLNVLPYITENQAKIEIHGYLKNSYKDYLNINSLIKNSDFKEIQHAIKNPNIKIEELDQDALKKIKNLPFETFAEIMNVIKNTPAQNFSIFNMLELSKSNHEITEENIYKLKYCLEHEVGNIYTADKNGDTLLHYLVRLGNYDLIMEFFKMHSFNIANNNGANINIQNKDYYTPLMIAGMSDKNGNIFKMIINNLSQEEKDNIDNQYIILANQNNKEILLETFVDRFKITSTDLILMLVNQNYDLLSQSFKKLSVEDITAKNVKLSGDGFDLSFMEYLLLYLEQANKNNDQDKLNQLQKIFTELAERDDASVIFNKEANKSTPIMRLLNMSDDKQLNLNAEQIITKLFELNKVQLIQQIKGDKYNILHTLCEKGDGKNIAILLNKMNIDDRNRHLNEEWDGQNALLNILATNILTLKEKQSAEKYFKTVELLLSCRELNVNNLMLINLLKSENTNLTEKQKEILLNRLMQHPKFDVNYQYKIEDKYKTNLLLEIASDKNGLNIYNKLKEAGHTEFNFNSVDQNEQNVFCRAESAPFISTLYQDQLESAKNRLAQQPRNFFLRYFLPKETATAKNRRISKEARRITQQSVNKTDIHGKNALYYAASRGNKLMMDNLLQTMGANTTTAYGYNMLMALAGQSNKGLLENYCDKFSNLTNKKDKDGNSLLHYATTSGSIEIFEYLLKNHSKLGLDINAKNKHGMTPLMMCVLNNDVSNQINKTNLILSYRADTNVRDKVGNTAMHYACVYSREGCIEKLAQYQNANWAIKNNDGHTPFSLAALFRNGKKLDGQMLKIPRNRDGIASPHSFILPADSEKVRSNMDRGVLNMLMCNGITPIAEQNTEREFSLLKFIGWNTLGALIKKGLSYVAPDVFGEVANIPIDINAGQQLGNLVGNKVAQAVKNVIADDNLKIPLNIECFIGMSRDEKKKIQDNKHLYKISKSAIFEIDQLDEQIKDLTLNRKLAIYVNLMDRYTKTQTQSNNLSWYNFITKIRLRNSMKQIEQAIDIITKNDQQLVIEYGLSKQDKKVLDKLESIIQDKSKRRDIISSFLDYENMVDGDKAKKLAIQNIVKFAKLVKDCQIVLDDSKKITHYSIFLQEYEQTKTLRSALKEKDDNKNNEKQKIHVTSKFDNLWKQISEVNNLVERKINSEKINNRFALSKYEILDTSSNAQIGFMARIKNAGVKFFREKIGIDMLKASDNIGDVSRDITTYGYAVVKNSVLRNGLMLSGMLFGMTTVASIGGGMYIVYKNKDFLLNSGRKFFSYLHGKIKPGEEKTIDYEAVFTHSNKKIEIENDALSKMNNTQKKQTKAPKVIKGQKIEESLVKKDKYVDQNFIIKLEKHYNVNEEYVRNNADYMRTVINHSNGSKLIKDSKMQIVENAY